MDAVTLWKIVSEFAEAGKSDKPVGEVENELVRMGVDPSLIASFRACSVCGKDVNCRMFAYALRQLQKQTCSVECLHEDYHRRFRCCDKAVPIHCVCMASYDCPVHGQTHVGTHD